MDSIRISIIQTDIVWENKQENLRLLHEKLQMVNIETLHIRSILIQEI